MKNPDNFYYAKEAITCNHQINTFRCQQRCEWNTKQDSDKFIVRTYCGIPKGTSWAEVTSNSEISKPVALAVIGLNIQLVSQLVSK